MAQHSYGVPRDVRSKIKLGPFDLKSIITLAGFSFVGWQGFTLFPKSQIIQALLFFILMTCIGVFLIIPANGDSSNMGVIWVFIQEKGKKRIRNYL